MVPGPVGAYLKGQCQIRRNYRRGRSQSYKEGKNTVVMFLQTNNGMMPVLALLATHLIMSCSAISMWGGPCYDSTSSLSSCMDCCQRRKCKSRCLDKCKNEAKSIANDKGNWCESFHGDYGSSSYYGLWDEEELHEHPRQDCNSENKCDRCEGDCDRDSHCKSGLKCFERDGTKHVPGCYGSGVSGWD